MLPPELPPSGCFRSHHVSTMYRGRAGSQGKRAENCEKPRYCMEKVGRRSTAADILPPMAENWDFVDGGGGWIRTSVRLRGQIYSLLPLTTRPPLLRARNQSCRLVSRRAKWRRAPVKSTPGSSWFAGGEQRLRSVLDLPPAGRCRPSLRSCAPKHRHAPGMSVLERVKGIEPSS
jgi:hypothetical protein